jgi:surface antigen
VADTGISLNVGDALKVSATGSWSADPTDGFTGPDGYSNEYPDNFLNLTDIGVCAYCASTPTPFWGALIGYIGSAPPTAGSYTSTSILPDAQKVFFVGSNFGASIARAGELWLTFNDDAYSAQTSDNSGQVTATITIGISKGVKCQCTTFVANYYNLPSTYPNAKDWAGWLSGLGWTQDSGPSVGDIMVMEPGAPGVGALGHVGIIVKVKSNGNNKWTITMDSANWNGGTLLPPTAGCNNVTKTPYMYTKGENISFYK